MEDIEPILLGADNDQHYKPLKTVPAFSFHLFCSYAISLVGIVLAITWKDDDRCKAYFIMLYLRAIFWIVTLIFDHVVKHHHEQLRLNGYHDFHKSSAVHKGVPLYIVSLWNMTIGVIQTLMQHYYGANFGKHCIEIILSPIVYITLFGILETIVLSMVNGTYIAKVVNFNRSCPYPDALCGTHNNMGSVGFTQRGADMAELFEKQADLINYLKDHNLKLNQKLMQLNAQVRTVSVRS